MIRDALDPVGVPYHIVGDPTLFEIVFSTTQPHDYRSVRGANPCLAKVYNDMLREDGVFKSPGKTYPWLALNDDDLDITRYTRRREQFQGFWQRLNSVGQGRIMRPLFDEAVM